MFKCSAQDLCILGFNALASISLSLSIYNPDVIENFDWPLFLHIISFKFNLRIRRAAIDYNLYKVQGTLTHVNFIIVTNSSHKRMKMHSEKVNIYTFRHDGGVYVLMLMYNKL